MTGRSVIKRALRIAQVIAQGEDVDGDVKETEAFDVFKSMISSWSTERLLVPTVVSESFTLTAGDGEYSIGSGGDFDTVRPLKVERAYIRDTNNNDFKVEIIEIYEYNRSTLKTTQGRPYQLYYRSDYPLGTIKLYYVPANAEELFMDSWKPLVAPTLVTDTINLSDEFELAFGYNLAVLLAPEYAQELPQSVYAEANRTKKIIKGLNRIPVSEIGMDSGLLVEGGRRYNINNDGYR